MGRGGQWFDGERLRATRLALGVSQRELADRSGVPQPSVSRIERGLSQPEPPTIRALAAALGVEAVSLLTPVNGPAPLAHRRTAAGLIQRQVADTLGIPPSTYAAIERGEIVPSPDLARQLDRLLTEQAG